MLDASSQPYRVSRFIRVGRLLVLLLVGTTVGCSADPEKSLQDAAASNEAGDFEGEREILRRALESSPDNVPLLLAAARYYLRSGPDGRYKPRLALHYAMRAARASERPSGDVSKLLFKAYRAAGSLDEERDLLAAGLHAVGHPDANEPRLRKPVDPDLLEPTLENLREQKRREEGGQRRQPCEDGMAYIPAGRYPSELNAPSGDDVLEVHEFCIDQLRAGALGSQLESAAAIAEICADSAKRRCSQDEMQVACGAMAGVLGVHPACVMNKVLRCCRDTADGSL